MSLTQPAIGELSKAISISRMTEHDLLEVVEIEEKSGLSRWGWGAYYAELQGNNRSLMLVARVGHVLNQADKNSIAGYIVARLASDEIHINNVAVRVEYQRQGLGCLLLNRILAEGKRLGATMAFLEVRAGNSLAQGLYRKCGFKDVGRRRGYYSTPPEDAVVMSAQLKPLGKQ